MVKSFTIATTAPNDMMAKFHDRMPVILGEEHWQRWLGEAEATPEELRALLAPYPPEAMEAWRVDPRVGNVRNDDPGLIEPI